MAHNTSSDSDNEITTTRAKLFPHEKPIHEVLGGGKVADVLLWRDRNVSAALLLGMTAIWFLFEVVEYNFVTLLCHISITTMLVLFIWSTVADILKWSGPQIPETILQDSFFQDLASIFHRRFNQLLPMLLYISCGTDLPRFLLIIVSLYILSVIGTYFSFVNLLYIGFLCMQTLPIVYDRYEEEINNLVGHRVTGFAILSSTWYGYAGWGENPVTMVGHIILDIRKKYRRFDKRYLNKIPRGPVKEKKTR